jgi:hypothetical protein
MRCTPILARRPVRPPNADGTISTAKYASEPTNGNKAMAQIHSWLRPVLITWTMKAA